MGTITETWIIISLLSGIICYIFAKEKNYNPYLWFAGGFIFSLLAIAVFAAIKKRVKKP